MRTLYFKTIARVRDQWSRRRIAHDTERMLRTLDTRTLRDGVYDLIVKASDIRGNSGSQTLRFTVHNRAGWSS